jgi:TonB family protein
MRRRGGDLDGFTAAAVSVMVHAGIGLAMWAAIETFVVRRLPPEETIIEIVESEPEPEPEPEPEVKLPEPEPEPEPEVKLPEPDPEPIPPTRVEPERTTAPPPSDTPPPSPSTDLPSPGPSTGETSAPVIAMPELGVDSTGVPVAHGKRPSRIGAGGGGTSTSGGGGGADTGSGTGSQPVSIASLKRRAKAKSGQDYFDASKDYPAEARRLGIEGKIRVKVEINPDGKVTKATLLNHLGHGLDELARDRARRLAFEPAIDGDDRPVASVEVWTFTFAIPD